MVIRSVHTNKKVVTRGVSQKKDYCCVVVAHYNHPISAVCGSMSQPFSGRSKPHN